MMEEEGYFEACSMILRYGRGAMEDILLLCGGLIGVRRRW